MKSQNWIAREHETLESIAREQGRTWDSPTGSWKSYVALAEDHDRQQAIDALTRALGSINYVRAWATLDGPESDSLTSAVDDIVAAIKEFSR